MSVLVLVAAVALAAGGAGAVPEERREMSVVGGPQEELPPVKADALASAAGWFSAEMNHWSEWSAKALTTETREKLAEAKDQTQRLQQKRQEEWKAMDLVQDVVDFARAHGIDMGGGWSATTAHAQEESPVGREAAAGTDHLASSLTSAVQELGSTEQPWFNALDPASSVATEALKTLEHLKALLGGSQTDVHEDAVPKAGDAGGKSGLAAHKLHPKPPAPEKPRHERPKGDWNLGLEPESFIQMKLKPRAKPAEGSVARCVFLHGSLVERDAPPDTNGTDYWGNIVAHTPQCREHVFAHVNTVDHAWHDREVAEQFCAVAVGNSSHNTIRDTIVFSHSAGTVALAAGIWQKRCDFDPATSSWYVSAFFPATTAHNTALDVLNNTAVNSLCDSDTDLCKTLRGVFYGNMNSRTAFPRIWRCLATRFSGCEDRPSEPQRKQIEEIVQKRATGVMCGCSASGLGIQSLASMSYMWASGPNDGVASCDVCYNSGLQPRNRQFSNSYRDAFYINKVNHYDLTCRFGDGEGDDEKPCEWYRYAS